MQEPENLAVDAEVLIMRSLGLDTPAPIRHMCWISCVRYRNSTSSMYDSMTVAVPSDMDLQC